MKHFKTIIACALMMLSVAMFPLKAQPSAPEPGGILVVGRFGQEGEVYRVAGAVSNEATGQILIGFEGGSFATGKHGFGIWAVDPKQKVEGAALFRREYAEQETAAGLPKTRFRAMCLMPDGEVAIAGRFSGPATSLLLIDRAGKVRKETVLFDGSENVNLFGMLATGRGDVLLYGIGPSGQTFARLMDKDFRELWNYVYESKKTAILQRASFSDEKNEFYLAAIAGTYTKFGVPVNDDSVVKILCLDYEGHLVREAEMSGMTPEVSLSADGLYLARRTVGKEAGFRLSELSPDLKVRSEVVLANAKAGGPPLVRPVVLIGRPDGASVAVVEFKQITVYEFGNNLESETQVTIPRMSLDPNGVRLVSIAGTTYLISTALEDRKQPAQVDVPAGSPPALTTRILVETGGSW